MLTTATSSSPKKTTVIPTSFGVKVVSPYLASTAPIGQEADMVYVVGLDNLAKNESNLSLRNQLFIALTRARGWVKLSGWGLSHV